VDGQQRVVVEQQERPRPIGWGEQWEALIGVAEVG